MVYLKEWAEDSFLLIQADWTAGMVRELLDEAPAAELTHIIIHRVEDSGEYYYLFTYLEAVDRLSSVDAEMPIRYVFNLHEYGETTRADAYGDAETAPDHVVIMDEGELVGFYDARTPPPFLEYNRGEDGENTVCSFITKYDEKVPLHQTMTLAVSLSATLDAAPAAGSNIAVPIGETVDIYVRAKSGFEIIGSNEGSLAITGVGATVPLKFELKAIKEGPGKIVVSAIYEGQYMGITLAPMVVGENVTVDDTTVESEMNLLPVSIHKPDLKLIIMETEYKGYPAIEFSLDARDPDLQLKLKTYGPIPFRDNPAKFFTDFFKDIDELNPRTADERLMTEMQLGSKGLCSI